MVPGASAPTARNRRAADILLMTLSIAACLLPETWATAARMIGAANRPVLQGTVNGFIRKGVH